jgi:hypothetical protein
MAIPDKEAIAKAPSGRVTRTPIGVRNVLTVKGKDPNYVYRVVNDVDDRVEAFIEGGYEVVKARDVKVGDKRVDKPSEEGSIKRISVGGGGKGVVMRIPKDWYEEDQAAKQKFIADTEATMKADALNGYYGKIETGGKPA